MTYRTSSRGLKSTQDRPMPHNVGRRAGTDRPHRFRPLGPTVGAPQCADCFGFTDDPRHP